MPTVSIGYGPNRREWQEDDPTMCAALVAEMIMRLNEDAHRPQQAMACALNADSLLANLESLHLETVDYLIWRRGLARMLVASLYGRNDEPTIEELDERDGERRWEWKHDG